MKSPSILLYSVGLSIKFNSVYNTGLWLQHVCPGSRVCQQFKLVYTAGLSILQFWKYYKYVNTEGFFINTAGISPFWEAHWTWLWLRCGRRRWLPLWEAWGEVTEVWRFGQLTWEKTLIIVSLAKQYQAFCWSCLAVLCFFEDRKAINKHNLETGCNKGFLPLTSIPVHANTIRLHWEENICLDPTHCLSLQGILSTWDSKY